jgi:hypothetical protein
MFYSESPAESLRVAAKAWRVRDEHGIADAHDHAAELLERSRAAGDADKLGPTAPSAKGYVLERLGIRSTPSGGEVREWLEHDAGTLGAVTIAGLLALELAGGSWGFQSLRVVLDQMSALETGGSVPANGVFYGTNGLRVRRVV